MRYRDIETGEVIEAYLYCNPDLSEEPKPEWLVDAEKDGRITYEPVVHPDYGELDVLLVINSGANRQIKLHTGWYITYESLNGMIDFASHEYIETECKKIINNS